MRIVIGAAIVTCGLWCAIGSGESWSSSHHPDLPCWHPTARQFRGFKEIQLARIDGELVGGAATIAIDEDSDQARAWEDVERLRGVREIWERLDEPMPPGCSSPCRP